MVQYVVDFGSSDLQVIVQIFYKSMGSLSTF
jgi:hypothetical protein